MIRNIAALGWIGWLICALGAVLLAVLANLYIFAVRPFGATSGIPINQTGPIGALIDTIVPYVWLFLYAGIGTTFWLLISRAQSMTWQTWLVVVLMLLCVTYPLYTVNLNQPMIALGANGVVIAVAVLAVVSIWPTSRRAAVLLIPVIAWVSLASVALLALITGQRF